MSRDGAPSRVAGALWCDLERELRRGSYSTAARSSRSSNTFAMWRELTDLSRWNKPRAGRCAEPGHHVLSIAPYGRIKMGVISGVATALNRSSSAAIGNACT